ncbi:hypothetical protein [Erythrobacter sp. THAF29]|uniref:hypothetical protein n=1 Tax=Erythrobacter sp. THAF29 TaxID=2587851 RepID=UPI0012AA8A1B|nr:hypothetical protein [Erythrobacter sp. THAF29]QFT77922.1 hypothetical protein FIU90_10280 [Erythrobacter sp. THAF29]
MTNMATISIVALLGWLVLAGGAMASYKLGWKKNVQLALIWVAIFAGGFVLASFFM